MDLSLALMRRQVSQRQDDVLRSAWEALGNPEAVIAFLNTRNEQLDGAPLHVALRSDSGLVRVDQLLNDGDPEFVASGVSAGPHERN
jgi:hypothetical protein